LVFRVIEHIKEEHKEKVYEELETLEEEKCIRNSDLF
jgi:hypothetical protein